MKIVNALILSCFLASVTLAQAVSATQTPPEVEVLFTYLGQRTSTFFTVKEIQTVGGITAAPGTPSGAGHRGRR